MCGFVGVYEYGLGQGTLARTLLDDMRETIATAAPMARASSSAPTAASASATGGSRSSIRSTAPADVRRARGMPRLQRRDLQLPAPSRGAEPGRRALRDRLRHRGDPAPLRARGRSLRRAAQGDVRLRALGPAPQRAPPRPRPGRREAPLLDRPRRHGSSSARRSRRSSRTRPSMQRRTARSLAPYLANLVAPAPATMFAGISKLEPGMLLRCTRDGVTRSRATAGSSAPAASARRRPRPGRAAGPAAARPAR